MKFYTEEEFDSQFSTLTERAQRLVKDIKPGQRFFVKDLMKDLGITEAGGNSLTIVKRGLRKAGITVERCGMKSGGTALVGYREEEKGENAISKNR